MRVSCPACQAETSLEILLGREVDARAVAAFVQQNVTFGELMVRYIALFRPPKRRLGIARMVALIEELLPDIKRGAINRKGRDWAAPRDAWQAALEAVIAKRDADKLVLPLTSHGLLYEILVGTAERAEARGERDAEDERRRHRSAGVQAEPQPLSAALPTASVGTAIVSAPAVPSSHDDLAKRYAQGPSRAALEAQALIRARRERQAQQGENEEPHQ